MARENMSKLVARRVRAVEPVVTGGQQDDRFRVLLDPEAVTAGMMSWSMSQNSIGFPWAFVTNIQQLIERDVFTKVEARHRCFRDCPFIGRGLPKTHCH